MELGSVAAFNFAASLEKPIPFVVNISGRYDFNHEQIASKRPDIVNGLKKQVNDA
jgi:hypothetical protein